MRARRTSIAASVVIVRGAQWVSGKPLGAKPSSGLCAGSVGHHFSDARIEEIRQARPDLLPGAIGDDRGAHVAESVRRGAFRDERQLEGRAAIVPEILDIDLQIGDAAPVAGSDEYGP